MEVMLTNYVDIFFYIELYINKAFLKWSFMEGSQKLLGNYWMVGWSYNGCLQCKLVIGFIVRGETQILLFNGNYIF